MQIPLFDGDGQRIVRRKSAGAVQDLSGFVPFHGRFVTQGLRARPESPTMTALGNSGDNCGSGNRPQELEAAALLRGVDGARRDRGVVDIATDGGGRAPAGVVRWEFGERTAAGRTHPAMAQTRGPEFSRGLSVAALCAV